MIRASQRTKQRILLRDSCVRDQLNTTSLVNESRIRLVELTELPAVLAQSVERVDCRAGGCGLDSRGRTNTQGLKITEK